MPKKGMFLQSHPWDYPTPATFTRRLAFVSKEALQMAAR